MVKEHLMDWMPDYYTGDNTRGIQEAREEELKKYDEGQERIIGDMYPSKAEDIDLWEKEYGVNASPSATLLQRQQNMLAYIRGGGGAITKEQIITLINSYTGTDDTEITEYPDEFMIKITCNLQPSSTFDLNDMKEMLYKMIQAHVGIQMDAIWDYEAETKVRTGCALTGEYIIETPIILTI